MKKHTGQTKCLVCHQEFAVVRNMRQHMVTIHGMSTEEVNRITNKRKSTMEILTEQLASGVGGESTTAAAPPAGPPYSEASLGSDCA